jgi:protein-tyrosine phosphatase
MIDLHTHILPEIDDGAANLKDALRMAEMAVEDGITSLAATHHFPEESRPEEYIKRIEEALRGFSCILSDKGIDLKIFHGAEVMIGPDLMSIEGLEGLCLNKSHYLLLELPGMNLPLYTEDVIYGLKLKGITPIIAHPERNWQITQNPNLLHPLISQGALAQVNSASITGRAGSDIQKCARILIEHNMAHIIASDAHSPRSRPPAMGQAAGIITKWFGRSASESMTKSLPEAILQDVPLDPAEPILYRKRLFPLGAFRRKNRREHSSAGMPPFGDDGSP